MISPNINTCQVLADSHSSNVKRTRDIVHPATIRPKLTRLVELRWGFNLFIDPPHKIHDGSRKGQ